MKRLFDEISRIIEYVLNDDIVNKILFILAIIGLFLIVWPRMKAEQDMIDRYNKTRIDNK